VTLPKLPKAASRAGLEVGGTLLAVLAVRGRTKIKNSRHLAADPFDSFGSEGEDTNRKFTSDWRRSAGSLPKKLSRVRD
jgi:hypothetical protein